MIRASSKQPLKGGTVSEQSILEGFVSIQAALEADSRTIHEILIRRDKLDPGAAWIERTAARTKIPVRRVDAAVIDAAAEGSTHGGMIAQVGARRFMTLDEIAAASPNPLVVMLDGVEDPFNFGQAVRALYAAGVDGLILRPRNWMSAAGVVARASAGASERIPAALAETVQEAADHFRARGLRIAAADEIQAVSLYEADLTVPLFVVIGGEKRGITRSFLETVDLRLRIPYARTFEQSLGTATASAVLAFEMMRQRRK
jgi:23S rRNA (guanosine2251-2'-O)-methyltransferase